MKNPHIGSLRAFATTFIVIGAVVAGLALIGFLVSLHSGEFGTADPVGVTSSGLWLGVGASIVSFGLLATLFRMVASAVDWRLTPEADRPIDRWSLPAQLPAPSSDDSVPDKSPDQPE